MRLTEAIPSLMLSQQEEEEEEEEKEKQPRRVQSPQDESSMSEIQSVESCLTGDDCRRGW